MSILTTGRHERPCTGYVKNTRPLSAEIERQTEEFLARGREITKLPGFKSGPGSRVKHILTNLKVGKPESR